MSDGTGGKDVGDVSDGGIKPEPPTVLKNIQWLRLHSSRNKGLVFVGAVVAVLLVVVQKFPFGSPAIDPGTGKAAPPPAPPASAAQPPKPPASGPTIVEPPRPAPVGVKPVQRKVTPPREFAEFVVVASADHTPDTNGVRVEFEVKNTSTQPVILFGPTNYDYSLSENGRGKDYQRDNSSLPAAQNISASGLDWGLWKVAANGSTISAGKSIIAAFGFKYASPWNGPASVNLKAELWVLRPSTKDPSGFESGRLPIYVRDIPLN